MKIIVQTILMVGFYFAALEVFGKELKRQRYLPRLWFKPLSSESFIVIPVVVLVLMAFISCLPQTEKPYMYQGLMIKSYCVDFSFVESKIDLVAKDIKSFSSN